MQKAGEEGRGKQSPKRLCCGKNVNVRGWVGECERASERRYTRASVSGQVACVRVYVCGAGDGDRG